MSDEAVDILRRLEPTLASLARDVAVIAARLDGVEKRLDDQGRILAALVPAKIAAVPPAAE